MKSSVSEFDRRVQLELLFNEHAGAVRAYAQRRIDKASADDVVSEVFVIAWRRLEEVPSEPLPWLLGCARRVLANQRRGHTRRSALIERLGSEVQRVEQPGAGEQEIVLEALASLRESDRELLMLIAWEGLTPAGAAIALKCSRATLAVRLHRARGRFARALARLSGVSEAVAPATDQAMEAVR